MTSVRSGSNCAQARRRLADRVIGGEGMGFGPAPRCSCALNGEGLSWADRLEGPRVRRRLRRPAPAARRGRCRDLIADDERVLCGPMPRQVSVRISSAPSPPVRIKMASGRCSRVTCGQSQMRNRWTADRPAGSHGGWRPVEGGLHALPVSESAVRLSMMGTTKSIPSCCSRHFASHLAGIFASIVSAGAMRKPGDIGLRSHCLQRRRRQSGHVKLVAFSATARAVRLW